MSEITRWVFTICCGTMLCGIVSVLSPGKGSERLMGMVLGLFMLCCFFLPAGLELDLDRELSGWELSDASSAMGSAADEVTRYFLEDTVDRAREELEGTAEQELMEYGINGEEFQIYIEADDLVETGLELTAVVTLPLKFRDREEELQRRLKERLGIAVRLQYRGEDDREGL